MVIGAVIGIVSLPLFPATAKEWLDASQDKAEVIVSVLRSDSAEVTITSA